MRLRAKVDPEDVLQSVCESFFRRHAEGEFSLKDWDSLWALLAVITLRKCALWQERFQTEGRNLDALPGRLGELRVWVTFNGGSFDLPVLRHAFPGLPRPVLHLDLKPVCRRIGLGGGLKSSEDRLGIAQQEYDQNKATNEQAEAQVLRAKANVLTSKLNLEYSKVVAPVSGRVSRLVPTGPSQPAAWPRPLMNSRRNRSLARSRSRTSGQTATSAAMANGTKQILSKRPKIDPLSA